jgi:hypothetical protein
VPAVNGISTLAAPQAPLSRPNTEPPALPGSAYASTLMTPRGAAVSISAPISTTGLPPTSAGIRAIAPRPVTSALICRV